MLVSKALRFCISSALFSAMFATSPVLGVDAQTTDKPTTSDGLVCREQSSDKDWSQREFKAVREGKNAKFFFRVLPDDYSTYGIERYDVTVLHRRSDAKKGDPRVPYGTTCARQSGDTAGTDLDAYARESRVTFRCKARSIRNNRCDFWMKSGEIKKIRDEGGLVLLRGLDRSGKVRLFDSTAFLTRESNDFKRGFYWGQCAWATIGLQVSRTELLFSKAALDAIVSAGEGMSALAGVLNEDFVENSTLGRATELAGFGSILLESVAIGAGVDINTGLVDTEMKLSVSARSRKAANHLVNEFVLNELEKVGDEILRIEAPNVRKAKGIYTFRISMGQSESSIRNLVTGLRGWADVRSDIEDIC